MNIELEENFECPYCGSLNALVIDHSGGRKQDFVTDCGTCCKPILIHMTIDENIARIDAKRENE